MNDSCILKLINFVLYNKTKQWSLTYFTNYYKWWLLISSTNNIYSDESKIVLWFTAYFGFIEMKLAV